MVRSSAGSSFEKRKHDGYAFVVGSFTYSIIGLLAMWPLGWLYLVIIDVLKCKRKYITPSSIMIAVHWK